MNSFMNRMSPSATNLIRMDHTHVLATFHQYQIDTPPNTKKALIDSVCLALEIHAQLEEEIFYPAMRELATDRALIEKSVPEHNEMKRLIGVLRGMQPTEAKYDETVMELMGDVMHHVADEETKLLPDAERLLGDRLGELGLEMTKRRVQLAAPRAGEIAANTVRAMPVSSMLMAVGAIVAGSYIFKRAYSATR